MIVKSLQLGFCAALLPLAACVYPAIAAADGSPTAIYEKYVSVAQTARSPEQVRQFRYQRSRITEPTGPAAASRYLRVIKMTIPSSMQVLKESIDGNQAILAVEGQGIRQFNRPNEPMYGVICMAKQDGTWKVVNQSWRLKQTTPISPAKALAAAQSPNAFPSPPRSSRPTRSSPAITTDGASTAPAGSDGEEPAPTAVASVQTAVALAGGTLLRAPFALERADYNGAMLVLSGKPKVARTAANKVQINFNRAEDLEGKTITVRAGTIAGARSSSWTITRKLADGTSASKSGSNDYALSIRFFRKQNGQLPGYLDLTIPAEGTAIKGYFYAVRGTDNASL